MKHTSQDIFADWKQNRFILADKSLHENKGQLIILTDFGYWAEHLQELIEWCQENGGEVNGSTVLFHTEQEITAFVLRWS